MQVKRNESHWSQPYNLVGNMETTLLIIEHA